jgi:hypothetical protein
MDLPIVDLGTNRSTRDGSGSGRALPLRRANHDEAGRRQLLGYTYCWECGQCGHNDFNAEICANLDFDDDSRYSGDARSVRNNCTGRCSLHLSSRSAEITERFRLGCRNCVLENAVV